MKDLFYYFDKITFKRYELGEVQTGFNMSLVIDGTKDSCKINIYSFSQIELTPNTICYHLGTKTWWVISNDKVSRYVNENGYMYLHELQLEGAIELLNKRDLTDCGFYSNRYTIETFINRLFKLSNFEYPIEIETNNNISLDKTIDYIKTFENYTLLSALREFLDGYNCVAKLYFDTTISGNDTYLDKAKITIVSKTGNVNVNPRNASLVFNENKEIKNTNKNNYGTSVISNAENVVSTKTKVYPSVGGVKLSSKSNIINGDTAILRIPSNIFKVNYVNMYRSNIPYGYIFNGSDVVVGTYDSSDPKSCLKAYNSLVSYLEDHFATVDLSVLTLDLFTRYVVKIPYCDNYNAVSDDFITNEPTSTIMSGSGGSEVRKKFVICPRETKDAIIYPHTALAYSRGDNYIGVFDGFEYISKKELHIYTLPFETIINTTGETTGGVSGAIYIFVGNYKDVNALPSPDKQVFLISETSFSLSYIPMSDIKIKMDNDGDTIDSNLYNQNGKLNDSNSLSKVLLSYVKEIESDIITKYGNYYGVYTDNANGTFDRGGMPNVGDTILVNDKLYVINNLSIDFNKNENENNDYETIGYFMTCEVSLSKKVATKSLLTSPNTNIRDYGIPQNNNVKRKQLYRDFYEFTYERESEDHTWYLPLGKVINLTNEPQEYKEHIAVIHTTFADKVNDNYDYYYQLETTTYFLKKSIYEIVDFKDNNIIGYGFQNLWSGFDITKIFVDGNNANYNIPISYVDSMGEVKNIEIKMTTIEELIKDYDAYTLNTAYEDISIYNASVFIPSDIYTYLTSNKYDFLINDTNDYGKDALEVPVFEYSCQIDDTDNILVGENILNRSNDDVSYLYSFIMVDASNYDDSNYLILQEQISKIMVNNQNQASYNNAVKFNIDHINDNNSYFELSLYKSDIYDVDDHTEVSLGDGVDIDNSKTLLVIRHTLNENDLYTNIVGELAENTPQASLPTSSSAYRNKIIVLDDGTYAICEPDQYTFELSFDSHCYGNFTLSRLGVYIYNDVVIRASATLRTTTLQDDVFSWVAHPENGYYIDGTSSDSGTISANYSRSVVAKKYRTLTVNWSKGVHYITFTLAGNTTSYYNPTPGSDYGEQVIKSDLVQGQAWSFEAHPVNTYQITGGGYGSGNTTSGDIYLSPTAEQPTYTFSIKAGGNVIVSGTVGDTTIFLSANQTYTTTVTPNTSYDITVSPRDSGYYLPSGSTTSYSGYVNSNTDLGTTASALAYRKFTINWRQGVLYVVLGGTSYYNSYPGQADGGTTVIKKEQDFGSLNYSSHPANLWTITSYASGTWYDSSDMTITPTAVHN